MRRQSWGGTFLDTFRYLDQLGRLAKQEVRVVAHNTLVASDYGLLEEKTFTPKPNYWAALLWRQLMGTTVLESGVPIQPGLHVYAHCLRGTPGGVALLAINTDKTASRTADGAHCGRTVHVVGDGTGKQERLVERNGTRARRHRHVASHDGQCDRCRKRHACAHDDHLFGDSHGWKQRLSMNTACRFRMSARGSVGVHNSRRVQSSPRGRRRPCKRSDLLASVARLR